MCDFRKLIAWQKGRALVKRMQPTIRTIKRQNRSVADQLDRSVSSIQSNIAEGAGRETNADFRVFLTRSVSSANEVEDHLISATDRDYLTEAESEPLIQDTIEVRKVTIGLRKSLG